MQRARSILSSVAVIPRGCIGPVDPWAPQLNSSTNESPLLPCSLNPTHTELRTLTSTRNRFDPIQTQLEHNQHETDSIRSEPNGNPTNTNRSDSIRSDLNSMETHTTRNRFDPIQTQWEPNQYETDLIRSDPIPMQTRQCETGSIRSHPNSMETHPPRNRTKLNLSRHRL